MAHDRSATQAVLSVYPLRLHFRAGRSFQILEGTAGNLVRGQLGKILFREHRDAYGKYFAPVQARGTGPSGFRDLPRPFVLRVAELEGAQFTAGEPFTIGVNLFEMRQPPLDLFQDVLTRVACESLGAMELERLEGTSRLDLPLYPEAGKVRRVRVLFRTPTELKVAADAGFASLLLRIQTRVRRLHSLYGEGELERDFRASAERARAILTTRSELHQASTERYSRTQQVLHPLGGFTGVAEYEGDLAEFLPFLNAAQWTGVGRQTVWGKGEIHCEVLGLAP